MIRLLPAMLALLMGPLTPSARADISDAIERVDRAVVTVRAGKRVGAGFVINAEGHIATNAHVVGKAKDVEVRLASGSVVKAEVVARDNAVDLAVLHSGASVDATVELGSATDLKLGEEVAALGAPLGLEHSVTKGILSSRLRRIGRSEYLQIDAALNPGSSGGPVIDSRGAVVGVSTIVAKGAENVGFAVPSHVLAGFLQQQGIAYDVIAGDTIESPAPPPMPPGPPPLAFTEDPPLSLPLIIAVVLVASILTSVVTSLLVLRVTLHRATQRLAAHAPTPGVDAPRDEDLSDVDITLQ